MRHEDSCQYGTEWSWAPVSSKAEQISLKIVESTIFESLNWNDLGLRPSVFGWWMDTHFNWTVANLPSVFLPNQKAAVHLVQALRLVLRCVLSLHEVCIWSWTSFWLGDVILISMTPIDSSENGHDWFWNLISSKVYLIPLSARRWLGGKRVWIPKVHG